MDRRRRRPTPRFCTRRRNNPHPCFGPKISSPRRVTTECFRTRTGRITARVEEKCWRYVVCGLWFVVDDRLACSSFLSELDVRRMLISTKCRLGGESNLHCPSCIHASDRNEQIHNSGFVIARGKGYYFRPPRRGICGIVSFVGRRPRVFSRGGIKVSPSQLIGLIYGQLLGRPVRSEPSGVARPEGSKGPFGLGSCSVRGFGPRSERARGEFCPCFGFQNVSLCARCTFRQRFYLTAGRQASKLAFTGLTFPLMLPGAPSGAINFRRQKQPGVSNDNNCGNGTRKDGDDRKL